MAITFETSTEIANHLSQPRVANAPVFEHGVLRYRNFTFTQVGAGDIGSTVDLMTIPNGDVRLVFPLSRIRWSAFGAARTLDIGYKAYTDLLTNLPVVAAPAAFDDDIDVSAAGNAALGSDATEPKTPRFESKDGLTIYATVAGGTIPAGATLNGFLAYVQD